MYVYLFSIFDETEKSSCFVIGSCWFILLVFVVLTLFLSHCLLFSVDHNPSTYSKCTTYENANNATWRWQMVHKQSASILLSASLGGGKWEGLGGSRTPKARAESRHHRHRGVSPPHWGRDQARRQKIFFDFWSPNSDFWCIVGTIFTVQWPVLDADSRCMTWWWMMKLPILPCAEKLELVLSTAPRTWDNTDKDSKNRKRSH